ncbi:Leucine-rich repeat-containing protein [Artemisia annua]|uniref:Leucine-rich repeat-containing protein n=1 Tax=Artemisia annua TaxID=35608 RepID=A0A2U1NSD8_ARTAN|nr:Leucine-rich repeat-containing protein [Artemisia annua]
MNITQSPRSETIEAIVDTRYDDPFDKHNYNCSAEVFKSMKKLRLLQVRNRFTLREPTYFPEQLKWLSWFSYPFQTLRLTSMTKLVGLEISRSHIIQLQIEKKVVLSNLKSIDLFGLNELRMFPDVVGVPNLERLKLTWCSQFVEIHHSVFLHEKIIHLDLSHCIRLRMLPSCIQMASLQTLHLKGCKSLERFPEVSMEMRRLLVLNMYGCDLIYQLPSSIRLLSGLIVLAMGRHCVVRSNFLSMPSNKLCMQGFTHLRSLKVLDLEENHLVDEDFPGDHHNVWPSLEEFECINIKELDELPPRIQVLKADHCRSLQKTGDLSNRYKWLYKISLHYCPKLDEDHETSRHISSLLLKSYVQKCAAMNHRLSITVPCRTIPSWFTNQRVGDLIALSIPQHQISEMLGLAICCNLHPPTAEFSRFIVMYFSAGRGRKLLYGTKNPLYWDKYHLVGSAFQEKKQYFDFADHVWLGYISVDFFRNLCHGLDYEDIIINIRSVPPVSECGVCVIYKDGIKPIKEIDSWVPDYDELEWMDRDNAISENLKHAYGASSITMGSTSATPLFAIHTIVP